jgi:hypothetical protein
MKFKMLAASLAAVLAIAAAAIYGVNAYAQREASSEVEASFVHLPHGMAGRHGAVSYSILGDRLVVSDVAIEVPDQWFRSVHAARVEVNGLNHGFLRALLARGWGEGENSWGAASVVASNVEYDLAGGFHQKIERVVVNDPRLEFAGVPPAEQWNLAQWIASLSWSSGEAVNFTASLESQSGARFTANAAARSFSELKSGRLADIADRGLVWDGMIPDLGKLHLEVGEAHTKNLDFLALDRIFDPASYGDAAPDPTFLPLCSDISLTKMAIAIEGSNTMSLSLDRLSVAGFKMRQLPFPPNAPPAQPTPGESLELLQSIALTAMEIDKLALTSPQEADSFIGLDRLVVKFDDKNHAEIANLSVKAPEASFLLGSMQMEGFDVRLPEKLLGALGMTPHRDEERPAPPRFFVERYELADLAFQHKAVGEISLKTLTLTMNGSFDKPTGGAFEMQRLGIDLATIARRPGAEMLAALGYGQVFFEAHGDAAYDVDAKTVESHFSFGAPEMGTLSFGYRLGNYDLDWDAGDTGTLIEQAMDVAVMAFEVRYDDASLADRVIDAFAAEAKQPPAAMRQSFVTMLEQEKSTHAGEPLVVNALDAAIDFLVKPTSIRLAARPARPVTLSQLYRLDSPQPNDLMTLLGVTVDRPQPAQ